MQIHMRFESRYNIILYLLGISLENLVSETLA